jgi:hypothetical protein
MEAWVLLDDGTALEQTPRQPPKGVPPVGVGNAGDLYSFVSFGFNSSSDAKLSAVVVAMEDQFHVFGTGPSRSLAAQSPSPLIARPGYIRWPLSDGVQSVSLMDQNEFLLVDLAGPSVPEFRGEKPARPSAAGLQVWVLKKDGTAAPPRSPMRESAWASMGGWATLSQQLTVGHARFEELAGVVVSVNGKLIMREMPSKQKNAVVPGM